MTVQLRDLRRLVAVVVALVALMPLAGQSAAADGDWWRPDLDMSWQIQLSGTVDTTIEADIFDVDLFDTPQATIDRLHRRGAAVICYFSAGSWEEWRDDASDFSDEVLGKALEGWPGERWLDVRSEGLRTVMAARLDVAVEKECDAVDPDNVDGYQNKTGFPLTGRDQLRFNRWLAGAAHERGLGVGLKNDVGQVAELVDSFDFQVNEECFDYDECDLLTPFGAQEKPVFQISYGDPEDLAEEVCPAGDELGFNVLFKALDLGAERFSCWEYAG